MLALKQLSATIEGKTVLNGISHTFPEHEMTALLGPNGSGKSTLGNAVMGAPHITVEARSKILFDGQDLSNLSPDKRAALGIFMTMQSPLPLPGVSLMDLVRAALGKKYSAKELYDRVHALAGELAVDKELLKRSLYDGFSGGERKKIEALQAILFEPKLVIFDEIDTGVDIDALKLIVSAVTKHLAGKATLLFITHSHKLLQVLHPDHVLIIDQGAIVKTGDQELANLVEEKGFKNLLKHEK